MIRKRHVCIVVLFLLLVGGGVLTWKTQKFSQVEEQHNSVDAAPLVSDEGDAMRGMMGQNEIAAASEKKESKSIDVHVLSITATGAQLVSSAQMEGTVKKQRAIERFGKLYYQLLDASGQQVEEGTLFPPREIFYDVPVNEKTGRLEGGRYTLPAAEVAIRVPSGLNAVAVELTDYATAAEGVFLGRIALPGGKGKR